MTATSCTPEVNKATVLRILDAIGRGDITGFTGALAPNYVRHCQAMPPHLQEIHGPAAMEQWLRANQLTFPDYREVVEGLVADGDFVAWRSTATGTQRGPLGPFPATGRQMKLAIIGVHRFEGPLIAETWTSWDNLAALSQLGLLPSIE